MELSKITLALLLVALCTRGAYCLDLTLEAGASGEDVVDACIQKINLITFFTNDFGFLKRIALVESDFGRSAENAAGGGIWRVSSSILETLTGSLNSFQYASVVSAIDATFNIDLTLSITMQNMNIPLYSALAARLYIAVEFGLSSLPGPLSEQADWWTNNYNLQYTANYFIDAVNTFENAESCSVSKLDLWFLIDGSGSIGEDNFDITLQFVADLASKFTILPDRVHTGFSVYSSSHTVVSHFNEHTTNEEFATAVRETDYPKGGTYTGDAIEKVVKNGFRIRQGMRRLSEGVPRVLIVLTDGKSSDDVLGPANDARDEGITVFAVGIGEGANEAELREIANDPGSEFAYAIPDFSQLVSVMERALAEQACQISAEIPNNTTVSVDVEAGNSFYSTCQLPSTGSIELEFSITASSGSGLAYISASVANPNSAIYDFRVLITPGTTVVTVNAGDVRGSLVLANQFLRTKRATGDQTWPLYLALQPSGEKALSLGLTSKESDQRAVVVTTTSSAPKHLTAVICWFTVLLQTILNM